MSRHPQQNSPPPPPPPPVIVDKEQLVDVPVKEAPSDDKFHHKQLQPTLVELSGSSSSSEEEEDEHVKAIARRGELSMPVRYERSASSSSLPTSNSRRVSQLRSSRLSHRNDLLKAAAACHFDTKYPHSRGRSSRSSLSQLETRTSLSSPGRTLSLRAKFGRLSRDERKNLLIRPPDGLESGNSSPVAFEKCHSTTNSLLMDSDDDDDEVCPEDERKSSHSMFGIFPPPPPPPPPPSPRKGLLRHGIGRRPESTVPFDENVDDETRLRIIQKQLAHEKALLRLERQQPSHMALVVHVEPTRRPTRGCCGGGGARRAVQQQPRTDSPALVTTSSNRIKLHIYDLIAQDTLMQLPWGFVCEIGKCFNEMNSALHELGTGVYHVGVEVNGVEYAFGATSVPNRSGVFSCAPRKSPGYQYRSTIDFGSRTLLRKRAVVSGSATNGSPKAASRIIVEESIDGKQVMQEMAREYMGIDYDILRKNCCSFATDACLRLGIGGEEIPKWFRNLGEGLSETQDLAYATVSPIANVLSTCEEEALLQQAALEDEDDEVQDDGFEIVAQASAVAVAKGLLVVDTKPPGAPPRLTDDGYASFRRTVTWTY